MAKRISIPQMQESNLVRNNTFSQKMSFYRHEGSGDAFYVTGPPSHCHLTGGRLLHSFDVDNQCHASPDTVFPLNGECVLKFRARGRGKIRAGVRWRLSYFRNDEELLTKWSGDFELQEEFQDLAFSCCAGTHYASYNDQLIFEQLEGESDITGISFFYPPKNSSVTFDRPHISAAVGEKINFSCSGADELLICYGHCDNAITPRFIPATPEVELTMRAFGGEGIRVIGLNHQENSRKSLYISRSNPAVLEKMRSVKLDPSPKKLLFFGDSLTAYDAGRNYTDIAGEFMPDSWIYLNAGVGGDDLTRLARRLEGRKGTYRLEAFDDIWQQIPDEIFFFYGANDTKGSWASNYTQIPTSPEEQKELLQSILDSLRSHAPQARINIIAAAPGFFPYQDERNGRLREIEVNHAMFAIKEHVENFNAVSREFAAANGMGYVDFYKVCMEYSDLQELFIPDDGVHMTLKGQQLLAGTLLDYLSR